VVANEGTVDRVLRIVVGLGILSLTVVGPKTLWGLVGLVPLLTGLVGYCPAYALVGLSTCPMRRPDQARRV
jgi:hypothetical protein